MKYFLTIISIVFSVLANSKDLSVVTVYFKSNSSVLSSNSQTILDNFCKSAKTSEIKIHKIIAYCDTVSSIAFNHQLAENRMNSVLNYISKASIHIEEKINAGEIYPEGSKNSDKLSEWRKVEIHYSTIKTVNESAELRKTSTFELLNIDSLSKRESKPIVLDIQFYPGVAVFYGDAENEIKRLFEYLNENEEINIFIRGHVCCNQDYPLSQARAETVFNFLADKGISVSRMQYKGYSNTIPLFSNELTELERQSNRRVDVIFSVSK